MTLNYEALTARNVGLVTEQATLRDMTVAIAGCGAEGGSTAVTLARMGVGALRLCDPDVFDESNLNRQWGSTVDTIGKNKAQVVADMVREVNPLCDVSSDPMGVTPISVASLCEGSDIVIEAVDYWRTDIAVMLHRECRARHIPVLVGASVGWGSIALLFEPDGLTFEEYVGADPTQPTEAFADFTLPASAYCPEPLPYVSEDMQSSVASGEVDIPVVAPSVNMTGAMLASFALFRVTGQRQLLPAPHYYAMSDLMTLEPRMCP